MKYKAFARKHDIFTRQIDMLMGKDPRCYSSILNGTFKEKVKWSGDSVMFIL